MRVFKGIDFEPNPIRRFDIEACTRFGIYGVDDALVIAGLAASAAGAGAGIAGNAAARSQMNSVRSAEVKRQADLQDQANSVFQKSISTAGADTAKSQTDKGAAQRQTVYNALKQVAQPTAGAPLPADASPNTVVNSDSPTQTANTLAMKRGGAWSALSSEAAAKEGGYQDQQTQTTLANAEANRRLGVIGARARGWEGIFPTEMEVAGHAGDALSGWGQLVSALGSTATLGGAMGLGAAPAAGSSLGGAPAQVVTDGGPAVSGANSDLSSMWTNLNWNMR